MTQDKTTNLYSVMYIAIVCMLLMTNTVVRSHFTELFYIGEISLYFTVIAMFFFLMKTWLTSVGNERMFRYYYIVICLFIIYVSVRFISTEYMDIIDYIQLLLHLIFILAAVRVCWNVSYAKVAGFLFTGAALLFFIHWVMNGFVLRGFTSVFRNENYLAVLMFSLLYFQVLALHYSRRILRSIFRIGILLTLILIFVAGARSVMIGILVAVLTLLLIRYYRAILDKLIYIIMLGNLLFVGIYVGLSFTSFGMKLNDISIALTNKNLFSGRHKIWEAVLTAIVDKPLFGYGLGAQAHDVADTDLTAHNMYLQIILEFGIFGYVLFFLLMVAIWRLLLKRLDCFANRWSLASMAGILVYNSFELTLFQNNYSIAVFQWLIITIGIGFMSRENDNKIPASRENRNVKTSS